MLYWACLINTDSSVGESFLRECCIICTKCLSEVLVLVCWLIYWVGRVLQLWAMWIKYESNKNLHLCRNEYRLCFHLIVQIGKMRRVLFGSVLVRSVFVLKRRILMPKHALNQLGVCTQTLITVVSVYGKHNMIFLLVFPCICMWKHNTAFIVRMHRSVY